MEHQTHTKNTDKMLLHTCDSIAVTLSLSLRMMSRLIGTVSHCFIYYLGFKQHIYLNIVIQIDC